MTKLVLVGLLACLPCCGAPFTAGLFSESGEAGALSAAGTAGSAEAGSAGLPSSAGAAGASVASGGQAGASAGLGGMAGAGGMDASGAGGMPQADSSAGGAPPGPPPCEHAIDTVSPGYLSLGKDTCYRTREVFDTLTCVGADWDKRVIKVNGQLAVCDKTQAFAPPYAGYNYFEITGAPPDTGALRWSLSAGST